MKRSVLFFAFIFLGLFSNAQVGFFKTFQANYYVSADGSDSNSGKYPWAAWKTIDKLNTATLAPGNIVAFRAGDTFKGTIIVGQSGSAGHPIVFKKYGNGANPKIYGSELITGWTNYSGNIYQASFATDIFQLFADNNRMTAARLNNATWSIVTNVASQTVVTLDIPSEADNYYTGCKVMVRTVNYINEIRTITASTGSTITLNSAPGGTLEIGCGMVIMGKLEFLDSPGEWFYDDVANTVYFQTENSDTPDGYEVRGSTINNGIVASGRSNISISNLHILQQADEGIALTGIGSNISVTNCLIEGQGNCGIFAEMGTGSSSNHNYSFNAINNVGRVSIYGYRIGNSIVRGNTISNSGLFESYGIVDNDLYNGGGQGIEFSDPDLIGQNEIYENHISNSGYNGIMWRGLAYIHHNFIYKSCMDKGDGGGIYTGSPATNGSVVNYNITDISDGPKLGAATARNWGQGIYLDEGSVGITVEHNTVIGAAEASIFMHKPYNHTVRYNKIISNRYGLWYANTPAGASVFTNNLIAINAYADVDAYEPRNLLARASTTTVSLNNNTYINPFSASDLVFRKVDGTYTDFAGWQATGQDAASVYIGTDFTANQTQRLVYNKNKKQQPFYLNSATAVDSLGLSVSVSFILEPFKSKYLRGLNLDCILEYSDAVDPVITAFSIPETSGTSTVTISTFTATDAKGVSAYKITQTETAPALTDAGWTTTPPATYSAAGGGEVVLYAWVRDAAGNISAFSSDTTTVPDLTANLLADYRYNQISGTISPDLVGSADGTISGTPAVDGAPLTLDGVDDNVTYPLPSVLSTSSYANDFSLNIKFSVPTTPAATKRIFYQGFSFTRGIQIAVNTNRDVYGIITENDTPTTSGRITSGGLTIDQVYNITITWNAASEVLKMYRDGTEITATYASNSLNGNSSGMIIGSSVAANYINASVYEFTVFDKELTGSEVNSWINR